MSIQFLKRVAAMPLPKSFNSAEDIDAIRILCKAGLLLATFDDQIECGARVLAITEKGRNELLQFHYPGNSSAPIGLHRRWLHTVAQRARAMLERAQRPGGRDE